MGNLPPAMFVPPPHIPVCSQSWVTDPAPSTQLLTSTFHPLYLLGWQPCPRPRHLLEQPSLWGDGGLSSFPDHSLVFPLSLPGKPLDLDFSWFQATDAWAVSYPASLLHGSVLPTWRACSQLLSLSPHLWVLRARE